MQRAVLPQAEARQAGGWNPALSVTINQARVPSKG